MDTLPPTPQNPRSRLSGHLYATCQRLESGACALTRKAFKSPIHVSKPYWDGQSLLLNLMCPTAGMLGGDQVDLDIVVAPRASLTLSNPSSLRIHKMERDEEATWTQSFQVEQGGFLENNPEWLILQGESAFTQRTSISVATEAELFFIEAIAPGRIAHGERFRFRLFRNRLELRYGGKLVALEKHKIEPKRGTARAWTSLAGEPRFYVSIHLISPKLTSQSPIWKALYELQSDQLRIGSSQLNAENCWNIKLLAGNPADARNAVAFARKLFYEAIGRLASPLRRQ